MTLANIDQFGRMSYTWIEIISRKWNNGFLTLDERARIVIIIF